MRLRIDCLEGLAKLDSGAVNATFTHALKQVVDDCCDRYFVGKERKVVLTLTVLPVSSEGIMDHVEVSWEIKTVIPSQGKTGYSMEAVGKSALACNEASLDNVRQRTLDDQAEDTK